MSETNFTNGIGDSSLDFLRKQNLQFHRTFTAAHVHSAQGHKQTVNVKLESIRRSTDSSCLTLFLSFITLQRTYIFSLSLTLSLPFRGLIFSFHLSLSLLILFSYRNRNIDWVRNAHTFAPHFFVRQFDPTHALENFSSHRRNHLTFSLLAPQFQLLCSA